MARPLSIQKLETRLRGAGLFRLFLASLVVLQHSCRLFLGVWAVKVFFILSGYWVTLMLQKKYSRFKHPFLVFYLSRYLRMAPVFLLCMGLLCLYLRAAPPEISFIWFLRVLPIVGITRQWQPLVPAWSLDVEMQFYLALPLLTLLIAKLPPRWRVAALVGAALGFAPWIISDGYHALIVNDLTFFVAGIAIYHASELPAPIRLAWICLASFFVIVLTCIAIPALRGLVVTPEHVIPSPVQRYFGLFSTLTALLVIPFIRYSVRLRSDMLDRHLGNLAYPVYLFHWIPYLYFFSHFGSLPPLPRLKFVAIQLIVVAVGSLLIYVFVDQPCERLREKFIGRLKPA
jgi:peptidoglycan/LPS O-acetylase OafA/YrhL